MKNIVRLGALIIPCAVLFSSCGSDDPQGQFVGSTKKGAQDNSGNRKRYVDNAAPSKWESDWSTENVVVYHWRGEPDNVHPTNGASAARLMVMDYTQRYLIRLNYQELGLMPDLAETLPEESADGLTYSYKLRPGVTWDDGSALSVDDVIFTLLAQTCPSTNNPQYKPLFEFLRAVEKDPADPLKFKVIMSQKYIHNVAMFANFPILQEAYHDKKQVLRKYTFSDFMNPEFVKQPHPDIEEWATEFNDAKYGHDPKYMNGIGPYRLTAWEEGSRMELVRKQKHWTFDLKERTMYDASLPDKLILRLITEESAIELGLKNQELDVSSWIGTKSLAELQKDSMFNRNYHSAFVNNFDWQYLGFNLKPEAVNRTPFFTDAKVRRAIALLVPADDINQAYLSGQATRMTSMVPNTRVGAYNTDLKVLKYDVEQAKKLLDEAGWKDSDGDNIRDKVINGKKVKFEFEFNIMTGNVAMGNMAVDIKNSLYAVGIIANIKEYDIGKFYQIPPTHDFDMYFGAWSGSSMPEDYKQLWHSSSWENGGSNYTGFSNAKADELIEKIRVTTVDSLRYPLEKELQAIIYEEQPYVFLFQVPRKVAIHKRFNHAYMFWEKPGVYLSWLELMSPSTMPATTN